MENINLKKAKIMVFAGAGASAGLELPTTPMFVKRLTQRWPKINLLLNQYRKYVEDIGESKKAGEPIDAEELRDWLVHIILVAEHGEYLLHNQPFETKVSDSSYLSQFVKKVLTEFDAIIRETYGNVPPRLAYRHYSQFLNTLAEQNIDLLPFFTTNYDLVMESLEEYEGLNWHIETGMERKGTHVVLNTKRFNRVSSGQSTIFLCKLHGSTDWWFNTNTDRVVQVAFGISPPSHYEELLIYPTREKFNQINDQPFSFFYDLLSQCLSSRELRLCIAIGYSFRDKFINEKFKVALGRGLRVLIIDPNMTAQHIKQIFPMPNIEKLVRIENIDFGHWPDPKRQRMAKTLCEELKEET